ncbi:MAG: hypothetical protein WA373_05270 [Burkholderiales bacterium]
MKRTKRTLRHLLVAVALLLSGQAAQLHALSHLERDLALIEHGEKNAPPLGHPAEQCLAFHAIGSALPSTALALELPRIALPAVASLALPLPFPSRIEFDSRAPPFLS